MKKLLTLLILFLATCTPAKKTTRIGQAVVPMTNLELTLAIQKVQLQLSQKVYIDSAVIGWLLVGKEKKVLSTATTSTVLNGSGYDPDGKITGYYWKQISGKPARIDTPWKAVTTVFDLSVGVYEFELLVRDSLDAHGKDTIKITVVDPN